MSKPILELKNVKTVVNKGTANETTILKGINLKINEGDFITIVGTNGAGKSTLFNVIGGNLPADSGLEGRAGPFRCLSVWPYPQAFGGQAGQNTVPESGNCGQGPAAYLRYINGRGRPDRRPNRAFG